MTPLKRNSSSIGAVSGPAAKRGKNNTTPTPTRSHLHAGGVSDSFITDSEGEETSSSCDEGDFNGGTETEESEDYKSESDSDGDFVSDESE